MTSTDELSAQLANIEADLGIREKPKRTRHRATAQGVAVWTRHYEGKTADARRRLVEMRRHGIPQGHIDEFLGASQALTPPENRCPHWGDKTYCPQCAGEEAQARREAEDAERKRKREERETQAKLSARAATISEQSSAISALVGENARLRREAERKR